MYELVGDDLMIPFGKVQDFTPYVAKVAVFKSRCCDHRKLGSVDFARFVKAIAAMLDLI